MNKKNIAVLVVIILVLLVGFLFLTIKGKDGSNKPKKEEEKLLSGKHYVEIEVEKYGVIKLELDANTAPITVTNFINLVNNHFYDGLTFHRIIEGFMIQGGGYEVDGSRKPTESIKGEFNANGVKNNISHKKGVISMARTPYDMDSASSEFFIVQKDSEFLDGNYAAFGFVIEGLDVVDKIAKKSKPTDDNGSISINERPVIKEIRVVEK